MPRIQNSPSLLLRPPIRDLRLFARSSERFRVSRPDFQLHLNWLRIQATRLQSTKFTSTSECCSFTMSTRDSSLRLFRSLRRLSKPSICNRCLATRRHGSSAAAVHPVQDAFDEVEQTTSLDAQPDTIPFDPLKAPRARTKQLPSSRSASPSHFLF